MWRGGVTNDGTFMELMVATTVVTTTTMVGDDDDFDWGSMTFECGQL